MFQASLSAGYRITFSLLGKWPVKILVCSSNLLHVSMSVYICKYIIIWRRQWHPTPELLSGKSHGWRSLVLQSMGSLGVRHDWATSLSLFTFMHWRRKWQPTPCSCLENPRDGGAWWAAVYRVAQSRTQLKRLSSSRQQQQYNNQLCCSLKSSSWFQEFFFNLFSGVWW